MAASLSSPADEDHRTVSLLLDNNDDHHHHHVDKEKAWLDADGATTTTTTTTTMMTTTTTKKKGDEEEGCLEKDEGEERQTWSRKREYILTVIGFIVGIGNIWRFPYMCNRNGGGAFLVPFLLCLVIMGFPLFFLETALGQFTGRSPLHVWSVCPLVKGVGIAMCILTILFVWYFNTIMAWALYYMVSSFKSTLPWSLCGQWWNTPHCVDLTRRLNGTSGVNVTSGMDGGNSTMMTTTTITTTTTSWLLNETADAIGNSTDPLKMKVVTAAEEFWLHNVLRRSSGLHEPGHLVWYLVVMQCLVVLFICLALIKGVKTSGKVVYVTATAPYILLTVLLIRGVTLPGAVDGILFYITPNFQRLLDPLVWIEAALQVFYSLGPAWGGVIVMASYNKFENNCLKDALILSFIGEGTSVFGGFVIFSILGYMAQQTGVHVSEVVSSGPGLVFIVYPEAISMLPLPQLWAVLFFFMLITIVIDTQLTGGETILTILCDSFPRTLGRHRVLTTAAFSVIALVSSLILVAQGGIYVFQLFDWFIAIITVTSVALIESVVLAWVYGADRFGEDIQMMIGRKPPMIIKIIWCFVNPILLLILLVITLTTYKPPTLGDYEYDSIGTAVGWIIALSSFVPIPGMAIYELMKAKGSFLQRLKQTTSPNEHWGPSDPTRRLLYRKKLLQRMPRKRFLDVLR